MGIETVSRSLARLLALPLGASLLITAPLAAQEVEAEAEEQRDCVCDFDFEPFRMAGFPALQRARIGVTLGEPEEVDGRRGIRLEDVETGGPAERAGIRAGDILTAVEGRPLGERPARRLLELMRDVEPGDTVAITYHRDGRDVVARVVTDERPYVGALLAHPHREARVFSGEAWPQMRGSMARMTPAMALRRMMRDGLELVPMNEGLGEYFGVGTGVLVAEVEDDSSLGLQAGDVILSIGGRAVEDPAHARAILRSYRADEEISFEVMRQNRRTTVAGNRSQR